MAKPPAARASSGACTIASTAVRTLRALLHVAAALVPRSPRPGAGRLRIFSFGSLGLAIFIGSDFFPTVDSGQMRLHARAPSGTRIEETEVHLRQHRKRDPQRDSAAEIDTIIDNIGLPNGGFNLAFGDSPTIGVGDGDILISLKRRPARSTADYTEQAAQASARRFPRYHLLLRSRQHHQPDSEFRPARAHRRAGSWAATPTPITRSPSNCSEQIATFPERPTCIFTRWSIIRRSLSTWIAPKPARWA